MEFADLVMIFHIGVLVFLALGPWVRPWRRVFLWFVPLIFFHWFLSSDICCLTVLEKKLRGTTFCEQLIGPVYQGDRYQVWAKVLLASYWAFGMSLAM